MPRRREPWEPPPANGGCASKRVELVGFAALLGMFLVALVAFKVSVDTNRLRHANMTNATFGFPNGGGGVLATAAGAGRPGYQPFADGEMPSGWSAEQGALFDARGATVLCIPLGGLSDDALDGMLAQLEGEKKRRDGERRATGGG